MIEFFVTEVFHNVPLCTWKWNNWIEFI